MDNDELHGAGWPTPPREVPEGPTNERTFWDEIADLSRKGLVKITPMMKAARTAEQHAAAWSRRIAHELDTFEHER